MAETSIQWTDYTFNPWVGCQRVSPGCVNCYAEAYDKRVGGVPKKQRTVEGPQLRWGPTAPRTRTSVSYWKQPLRWDRVSEVLSKAGNPRLKVFCASLADVFEDRPELEPWRADLFKLIAATPHLDWLLLTKRPENLARMLPTAPVGFRVRSFGGDLIWPNVWLGTTVEDQQRANERIPHLVAMPAAVRFLSCEPLLGPLDLSRWMDEDKLGFVNSEIDWVIIGGESHPAGKARRFDLAWARSLIGQCRDGGRSVEPVPFMKQLGSNPIEHRDTDRGRETILLDLKDGHGGDPSEWPADLRVREFPEARP